MGHFLRSEEMAQMIPPFLPLRVESILVTGVLELMGAVGVWVPRLRRLTGLCLVVMLVGLTPFNIWSAIHRVDFGGHGAGPLYLLVRLPFQAFVIVWTAWATRLFAGRARANDGGASFSG